MIPIKDYLSTNFKSHKFILPLGMRQYFVHTFMISILRFLPLSAKLVVQEPMYPKYYWEVIFKYLRDKLGANLTLEFRSLDSHLISYVASITSKDNGISHIKGNGVSRNDWEMSISKALGEYLERYSTNVVDKDTLRLAQKITYAELENSEVNFRKYHGFSGEQLLVSPNMRLTPSDIISTLQVEDLYSTNKVRCPVSEIFWGYYPSDEKRLLNLTTSGCAGGFNLDEATLSAVYECIERDSFSVFWLNGLAPDVIRIDRGHLPDYDYLQNKLNNTGMDLFVLNTTTDLLVPSIVCVAVDRKSKGVFVAGGCAINFREAINKACNEMLICVFDCSEEVFFELPKDFLPHLDNRVGRKERLSLWRSGKYFTQINFFLSGSEVLYADIVQGDIVFDSSDKELNHLLAKLRKSDLEIYRYQFQNAHLSMLDYRVVRILIPKLYPLFLLESMALINSTRLKSFCKFKTGKDQLPVHTFPHPFP